MKTHRLKTWPDFYYHVASGDKTFEVRRDDRTFRVGDTLVLAEWDPKTKTYTGRETRKEVSYILTGGGFGVELGYVVMGLASAQDNPT